MYEPSVSKKVPNHNAYVIVTANLHQKNDEAYEALSNSLLLVSQGFRHAVASNKLW